MTGRPKKFGHVIEPTPRTPALASVSPELRHALASGAQTITVPADAVLFHRLVVAVPEFRAQLLGLFAGLLRYRIWRGRLVLIVTGAIGFCPLYRVLGVSTCKVSPRG